MKYVRLKKGLALTLITFAQNMVRKYLPVLLFLIAGGAYSACSQPVKTTDTAGVLTMGKIQAAGPSYDDLIKPMTGTWDVVQKVWPKAGAEPVVSVQIARRTMVGHFLQEIMEPTLLSDMPPFTRITYLNLNNANQRWEYIVLDTRYPVMMFESSYDVTIQNGAELTLYLPAFVMPPGWDDKRTGQLARQRRIISFEGRDKTVMRQYWTLPGDGEFLAMEYTYTRQRASKK